MVGPPGSHSDILIAKLDPTSPSLSPIRTRGISVEPIHRESRSVTLIDQEIEEEEALAKDSVMISSDEMGGTFLGPWFVQPIHVMFLGRFVSFCLFLENICMCLDLNV